MRDFGGDGRVAPADGAAGRDPFGLGAGWTGFVVSAAGVILLQVVVCAAVLSGMR